MKNELKTGNEDISASTQSTPSERRPSLIKLEDMVKKVSQSPFHNQSAESPAVDSTGSFIHEYENKNEVEGHLTKTNPFYQHYLDSSKNGYSKEHNRSRISDAALDSIFSPPLEFQSSHRDLNIGNYTVQHDASPLEPQQNPLHSPLFAGQTSALADRAMANGIFPKEMPTAPGPEKRNSASMLQHQNTALLKNKAFCVRPAAEGENLFPAEHRGEQTWLEKKKLFDTPPSDTDISTSASNKEPVEHSRLALMNPFHRAPTTAADFFSKDSPVKDDLFIKPDVKNIFTSPGNAGNPFPSPVTSAFTKDYTNVDPFDSPLSKQEKDFERFSDKTSPIFQPLPPKPNLFETPRSSEFSPLPYNARSVEVSPGFPEEYQSHQVTPTTSKSLAEKPEVILTTPQGTKQNIMQPTPFTRARNWRIPSSQSPPGMTHVPTLKRPPKPLPRTRALPKEKTPAAETPEVVKSPAVPERPPKLEAPAPPPTETKTPSRPPFKPIPKPVIGRKPKTPEYKAVSREDYVVFQEILLTGQEKCVEDWPKDSPELSPNFKPSGTLRLRRESLKAKADSDGGSGEDPEGSGAKRKDSKFKMSLPSRRGSKERVSDDAKEGHSKTLPSSRKSSKEYSSSDLQMSAEENGEELTAHKKKPLKHRVSHLLRRGSSSTVSEGKQVNGNLQPEAKDWNMEKRGASKKESFRQWSEGAALSDSSAEEQGDEEEEGLENQKEQKKKRVKIKFVPQRGFSITVKKPDHLKGAHGYTPPRGCKAEDLEDVEDLQQPHSMAALQNGELCHQSTTRLDNWKPPRNRGDSPSTSYCDRTRDSDAFSHHVPQPESNIFAEDDRANLPRTPASLYDGEQDELGICKQKKSLKLKRLKKLRVKKKSMNLRSGDPPRPASSDYISDAARAEWLAAQRDEQGMADLGDEEEEGDTDSLMEWWYTVEQWDEVPSDDEDITRQEDESKSFTMLADKVQRGLRVFNKVFTERAEFLWHSIIMLHSIADNISTVHQKAKKVGIGGGTTSAVGGVAAIAGLALAPLTFGASLIITAVGVGVATAGGITSASAAISDNVNNMHDRKKVEIILQEYEGHLLDLGKILHFVNQGLYKLRGHPFLRSGTQHYSEDWEVRSAVQMIGQVDTRVMSAVEVTDSTVLSVQGLFKGMDKYFVKDSRELKKGCKMAIVAEIKAVADILNNSIVTLNAIREELQDATGHV